jgi:hypothetical protein
LVRPQADICLQTKLQTNCAAQHHRPGSYFQGSIYAYNAVREDKQIKSIKHETGGKMFTRAEE